MKVVVGKTAPDFSLTSNDGELISLADLKGKNVVLYFYPKDDTPGCTIEAQDFSRYAKEFEDLNTIILGISKDNIDSHCKFITKYNLTINLLSDETGKTCEDYGVIKEKSMFGKKYMGIDRSTFLINKIGRVSKVWHSVSVKGHVEEVLEAVSKL